MAVVAMVETVPERDLSGTVIERYRLLRRLGQGGMGVVYEAQHELLDRKVAIKVLTTRLAADERARKRFLREARAASRVRHDNVIEIHDVGFAGEHVFFVMELLQGRDLADLLDGGKTLSWEQARPILLQVTAALAAAHEAGVIHRDVKPANCFLVKGEAGEDGPHVKVLDFGIAKVASSVQDPVTELTTTGQVMGTIAFMPPEISQGITNDPRSDIYAMGVMMFRMLTGRLPFVGSAVEVVAQHINREPPSLRSLEPSVPEAVERIVLRALRKEPEDRQPSMRALREELGAVGDPTLTGMPRGARAPASRTKGAPRSPAARASPGRASPGAPSMSQAPVIGLDELPPRQDVVVSPERSAGRGWTSAYGEEPEPAPPPMPGQTEAVLELDVPEDWAAGQAVGGASPSPAPRRTVPWGPIVGGAVVVALAVGGWTYRDRLFGSLPEGAKELVEGGDEESEAVLLLVDTKPKGAKVYVDDRLTDERPIRLPRSEDYVRVRVEAEGYEPRTIQVQPVTTRRLEVALDRAKKR